MGDHSRQPDRERLLRALGLQQAATRWQAEILQRSVQSSAPQSRRSAEEDRGGDVGPRGSCAHLILDRQCLRCGGYISRDARSDKAYCSTRCAYLSCHDLAKDARREARGGRRCAHCGGDISAARTGNARYCSDRCQRAASRARERVKLLHEKRCPGCGAEFRTKERQQVFCTNLCSTRSRRVLTAGRFDKLFGRCR